MTKIDKNMLFFMLFLACIASLGSIAYAYTHGLILAYGDAESHINIAKRVVSGLTPGFGQLGGAWLPLPHMLMIPFVWNDFLWRSGLAGTIIASASYILSVLYIFKLIRLLTPSRFALVVGVAVFALNPNILYMQTTPLGELPLICSLVLSSYYLVLWAKKGTIAPLILASFAAFAGTLMRYDAWFLVVFEVLAVAIISLIKRYSYKKIEGTVVIYAVLAFLGIALWALWNYLIFKDPIYFLNSPYSAKSQQMDWLARGELPSYKNIINSVSYYSLASAQNAGVIVSIVAVLGMVLAIGKSIFSKNRATFAATLALLTPYIFYVVTLYLGISILLVPELVPSNYQWTLFNIRYGIIMVPAVAVFLALLTSSLHKFLKPVIILVLAMQAYLFIVGGTPVSLKDGTVGLSSRRPSPATNFVKDNYDYGYVMFDDFARSADPIDLNIPFENIIYVGNHPQWENALAKPQEHVRWLIVRHDKTDAIWRQLSSNTEFAKYFDIVYRNGEIFVYKRKS